MRKDDDAAAEAAKAQNAKRRVPAGYGRTHSRDNEAGSLADRFLAHNYSTPDNKSLLYCYDKFFWKYDGQRWVTIDEDVLKDQLYLFVRDNAESKRTSGLLDVTWKLMRASIRLAAERQWDTWLNEPPTVSRQNWLAFRNGILNLDRPQDGLRQHTPEWFSRTCLPFNFTPGAAYPQWLEFLQGCFTKDPERIALLQEWFGYCLTPDTSQQKFMLLEGPTRAGKGVTANVLKHMIGDENTSDIALEGLASRFEPAEMAGKLINICDETDQIERVAEAKLKRFTGATSKFFYDVKGVRGFSEVVTARLIILTNNGIPIYDRSSAIIARMLHLPYDVSHRNNPDTGLQGRLFSEAAGIFNWALEGYERLKAAGQFTQPARSAEALQAYEEQSNPFKVWFDEYIEYTGQEGDYIGKLALLQAYNKYLIERGHRPVADNLCARMVRQACPKVNGNKRIAIEAPDGTINPRGHAWGGIKWQ